MRTGRFGKLSWADAAPGAARSASNAPMMPMRRIFISFHRPDRFCRQDAGNPQPQQGASGSPDTTSRPHSAKRWSVLLVVSRPEIRGRGECRMRAAPAVPCAKWVVKKRTRAYRFSGEHPTFPAQWLYGLLPRSPWRRIRLVTIAGELTAYPRPVGPTCLRQLDTSNGCRNHTASPYAATSFVCAPFDRSRVRLNPKPALPSTFRA